MRQNPTVFVGIPGSNAPILRIHETPGALQDSGVSYPFRAKKATKKDGKTENFQEKSPKKDKLSRYLGARVSFRGKAVASPESFFYLCVVRDSGGARTLTPESSGGKWRSALKNLCKVASLNFIEFFKTGRRFFKNKCRFHSEFPAKTLPLRIRSIGGFSA